MGWALLWLAERAAADSHAHTQTTGSLSETVAGGGACAGGERCLELLSPSEIAVPGPVAVSSQMSGATGMNGGTCSKDRKVEGGGTRVPSGEGALRKKMYLRIQ